MRHRVFGHKLSRDINARKALLSNLATSLIVNGKLVTTVAKAKFAGPYVEKLITSAKGDRLFTNRKLASVLSPAAFKKLVGEIAPGFSERHGGYLRIVKQISRRGDNAQMARLELLEWDKTKIKVPKVSKGSKVTKVSKTKPKRSKVTPKSKLIPRKAKAKSTNSNKK